jgi:hypothetical protein
MFTIAIADAQFKQLQLTITDVQGKQVYNELDKNISADFKKQLNVEGLTNGVYFIKLATENEVVIQRLIIQ